MKTRYAKRIRQALRLGKADAEAIARGGITGIHRSFKDDWEDDAYARAFNSVDIPEHISYSVNHKTVQVLESRQKKRKLRFDY